MLYVTDLDRSINFYTSATNLKLTNRLDALTIEDESGKIDSIHVKMAFLKFEGQQFVLEISERVSLIDSIMDLPTYQHIGFEVEDIETESRRMISAGATALSPVRLVGADGVSAKTAFFKGPDGEMLELMQMVSGEF